MPRQSFGLSLLATLLTVSAVGQENLTTTGGSTSSTARALPQIELSFSEDKSVPLLPASPVLASQMQCAADGSIFVEMLQPPVFEERSVYSVGRRGVHAFDPKTVPSLRDPRLISYFSSTSLVSLLLSADGRSDSKTEPLGDSGGKAGTSRAARRYFIAQYDSSGTFQNKVSLDVPFIPMKLAVFGSGKFLLLGVDAENNRQVLVLLAEDGTLLRYLDRIGESDLPFRDEKVGPLPVFIEPQIIPYRNGLLLLQSGSILPAIHVKEGGQLSKVTIVRLPDETVVDSVVVPQDSDDADYFVRVRRSTEEHEPLAESDLYQASALDGRLLRRIIPVNVSPAAIACHQGSAFMAIRRDENGNIVVLKGQL